MTVGTALRDIMKEDDLRAVDIASRAGLSYETVQRLLRGSKGSRLTITALSATFPHFKERLDRAAA